MSETEAQMDDLQNPPIFIEGELEFTVESYKLSFSQRQLSVFGVTGLPWEPLSPRKHFGIKTRMKGRIPHPHNFEFECEAYIMRETSGLTETMGLKFRLKPEDRKRLEEIIARFGNYPNDYSRKYPRIPASPDIGSYPMRVLANSGQSSSILNAPIILDVRNLSVGGILVSTENPFALAIVPGSPIDILFEPRGDFSAQIAIHGVVRRVSDEISWDSGNVIRYLGMQFTEISGEDRAAFMELLRDILVRLKKR